MVDINGNPGVVVEEANYDKKTMQANFSALLYLLTEQQAMIGKLLQALLDSGVLRSHQLSAITDMEAGDEGLHPTYTLLYQRYAQYFMRTKELLDNPPDPDGTYRDKPKEPIHG
jgi:hypothetical protein